jgi:hypothetical protein
MKTEIFWGPKIVGEWNPFLSIEMQEKLNISHLSIEVYPRCHEIAKRFQSIPNKIEHQTPIHAHQHFQESGIALSIEVAHPEIVWDLLREYQTLVSLPYKLNPHLSYKIPLHITKDANDSHVLWVWMMIEDAQYILDVVRFLRNRYTYIPDSACQIIAKLFEQCLDN